MTCPECAAEDAEIRVIRVNRNRTPDGVYSSKCDTRVCLCDPTRGGCGYVFYTETWISEKKPISRHAEQTQLF